VISKNWKFFPKKEKKNFSNLKLKKIILKNFPNKFLVEKSPAKFVTKKIKNHIGAQSTHTCQPCYSLPLGYNALCK
jgi:hypothetical protein